MSIEPIVKIKTDFDPSEAETVSFSKKKTNPDGSVESTKCTITIVNFESSEEAFLYLLSQFKHARRTLEWTGGDDLANKFSQTLQGSYLEDWNDMVQAVQDIEDENRDNAEEDGEPAPAPPVHDEAWFDALLEDMKFEIFKQDDWNEMKEYISTVCKPMDMSPRQLEKKLRHLETMSAQLPSAPAKLFTTNERKRNYLRTMPDEFKKYFKLENL